MIGSATTLYAGYDFNKHVRASCMQMECRQVEAPVGWLAMTVLISEGEEHQLQYNAS